MGRRPPALRRRDAGDEAFRRGWFAGVRSVSTWLHREAEDLRDAGAAWLVRGLADSAGRHGASARRAAAEGDRAGAAALALPARTAPWPGPPPRVTFWIEFASTYAYLAIQRAEARAAAWGVALDWRPFLLGPIFRAQGWDTSPFVLHPAKGAYMWRDVARRAEGYGLPFERPDSFPANGVAAARQAIAALRGPEGPAFCRAVSTALYGQGRDIADAGVLAHCALAAGLDPEALAAAGAAERDALRANTEAAMAAGVFGAPFFHAGEEPFWGEDRMEDAFAFAAARAMR
jgi:2-hydroxychromene-2-carboxylate isomerase